MLQTAPSRTLVIDTSRHVDRYAGQPSDITLTVCDSPREQRPSLHGAKRMAHHSLDGPGRQELTGDEQFALVTRIRNEIGDFSQTLLSTELAA